MVGEAQHQKSHYLLPLNSMIFKSKSSISLPWTSQRNIYTKSNTTLTHVPNEESDDDITALPTAPTQHGARQSRAQCLGPLSIRSRSRSLSRGSSKQPTSIPDRSHRRSRSMNDLGESHKKKASAWRRFVAALKKPFRKEKEPIVKRKIAKRKSFTISGPTDFQHLSTGFACLPAGVQPTPESDTEDWETVRPSHEYHG